MADEWVVVWLLKELSKRFPDAWIRVSDTDGEFLLIEAANMLPRWLNPEIAEHRIWLNQGRLRIIPPRNGAARDAKDPEDKKSSGQDTKSLSLSEAMASIRTSPGAVLHSPLIEEEAFYRIRNYPGTILSENMHHALITIPRSLASILNRNPRYVSHAIEAFYLRDPISLKPLKSTPAEDLHFPPADLVTVSVRFSKVMFAQIRSQDFVPPPSWAKVVSDVCNDEKASQRMDAGVKVSSGFEMLLFDPANKDKQYVRELQVLLEDIRSGEEELPSDEDIQTWIKQEDDEKWLEINFEDFDEELSGRTRAGVVQPSSDGPASASKDIEDIGRGDEQGFGDRAAQENLRKMVSRFESFLNSEDAEHAEYLDDMDFDDDDDASASNSDDSEEDKVAGVDDEEFERAMRQMMGLPPEQRADAAPDVLRRAVREIEEYDESDEEAADEAKEIRKMAAEMEKELSSIGALNLGADAAGFEDTGRSKKHTGADKAKGKQRAG